ncbi:MAG: hypothetical protein JKY32_07145 [Rhizobiales bacterium]|nr:hypothetical protein [Hyphomicrobiales bacterium]
MASESALCPGIEDALAAHSSALAASPDDASVLTGDVLVRKIDAFCS